MAGTSTSNASKKPWSRSGFTGVWRRRSTGRWEWQAMWKGVRIGGAGFYSAEDASAARLAAIRARWPDHPAAK